MANPRRKNSKARTAKRRSTYKVRQTPQLSTCTNCGSPKLMHRACMNCGHYRGRAIVEIREA